MEIGSLLAAVGGVLFGASAVWLVSQTLTRARPRRDREQVIRLEVRAKTLHEHVHRTERERPYTAEEVGDALFGGQNERGETSED